MKRIFSTDKWYESLSEENSTFKEIFPTKEYAIRYFEWVKVCEGKEVVNNKIDEFTIPDSWCVNVD